MSKKIELDYDISVVRPFVKRNKKLPFQIGYRIQSFYNNGHTNLDNNSEIISYPKMTSYYDFNLTLYTRFLYLRLNPTFIHTSAKNVTDSKVGITWDYLNDRKQKLDPLKYNLYQSTIAMHYKGLGFGISNESMWFGPSFHSSLSMSNNSPGFSHYFIGTLEQIRFNKLGFNFRYFAYENNESTIPFFHSAIASSVTFYTNPIIVLGYSRSYLSRKTENIDWDIEKAAKLVFEPLFGSNNKEYAGLNPNEPDYWEPWDQMLSSYLYLYFPKSKIHTYLEIGSDDARANIIDLRAHWDHNIGYVLGFRKYGIHNNDNIFFGYEYISTKNSTNTHKEGYYRGGITDPNYYTNNKYLFSTYRGRRWGAHSGSDSDDLIILFGYSQKPWSLIYSYNIERRGVSTSGSPEIKKENSAQLFYNIGLIEYSIYFEIEKIMNHNFNKLEGASSSVFGISINYIIN